MLREHDDFLIGGLPRRHSLYFHPLGQEEVVPIELAARDAVASLEDGYDPARAVPLREPAGQIGYGREVLGAEPAQPERVIHVGVKARAQNDKVRGEVVDGGANDSLHGVPDRCGSHSRAHGDVQDALVRRFVPALPREYVVLSPLLPPLTLLRFLVTLTGISYPGLLRAGMHADVEESGVVRLAEDFLSAVAVVDIKVNHADPLQAEPALVHGRGGVFGGRRGGVEKAKAVA
mmetsp:Transcript_21252/g.42429  ORF Transcript_21252/g.42429 Transcript_21252/m.42429 type:complete len:233 (+) Transcript_21252:251-949(+)